MATPCPRTAASKQSAVSLKTEPDLKLTSAAMPQICIYSCHSACVLSCNNTWWRRSSGVRRGGPWMESGAYTGNKLDLNNTSPFSGRRPASS